MYARDIETQNLTKLREEIETRITGHMVFTEKLNTVKQIDWVS